jgi:hypothetical protein
LLQQLQAGTAGADMNKTAQAFKKTIGKKLEKLPAKKQAEVLSFVESLEGNRSGQVRPIYNYSAALVKRKRLKRLSLSKIAAIVHEVRPGRDSARSL